MCIDLTSNVLEVEKIKKICIFLVGLLYPQGLLTLFFLLIFFFPDKLLLEKKVGKGI